jgi:hypothetical protein
VFTLAKQQEAEGAGLFAQIEDPAEKRAPVALQKTFNQDPRLALAHDSGPPLSALCSRQPHETAALS